VQQLNGRFGEDNNFCVFSVLKFLEGEVVVGGGKELQGMAFAMQGISAAAERERTHSPLPACG
jgi:hypothetical protein